MKVRLRPARSCFSPPGAVTDDGASLAGLERDFVDQERDAAAGEPEGPRQVTVLLPEHPRPATAFPPVHEALAAAFALTGCVLIGAAAYAFLQQHSGRAYGFLLAGLLAVRTSAILRRSRLFPIRDPLERRLEVICL